MENKSIIPFLISAIILFSDLAIAQFLPFYGNKTSSNTLSMSKLKGKVKSIEQKVFLATDSLGKVVKGKRKFDNSGSVNTDFLIQLDSAGRSIKENYYTEKYTGSADHKFDNIKNIETVEEYYSNNKPGKISRRAIYKYNTTGSVIQLDYTQFFKDNSPSYTSKYIYKYDEKGNLIESTLFAPNQKPLKTTYKNDDKGNMVSFTTYGEEGKIWGRETFKIDANENISEHAYSITDTSTIEHSFTYKYDKNKNVIEKNYFKPGVKSKKYTFEYEYDKVGNWIKRIDFENDKAVLIAERKFEYY